jgi:hypothetical protein
MNVREIKIKDFPSFDKVFLSISLVLLSFFALLMLFFPCRIRNLNDNICFHKMTNVDLAVRLQISFVKNQKNT